MGKWYVYILLCEHNYLYTGITQDIEKRFGLHSAGKGAKFTQKNKPIKVVYAEKFTTKSDALKRERELKILNRRQKDLLIKKQPFV